MKLRWFGLSVVLACCGWMAGADARAQTSAGQSAAAAAAVCDGVITTVRVSDIKPGKQAMFKAAVAAHQAWYRSHGVTTDQMYIARVLVEDPSSGKSAYSENELATFHINPPSADLSLPRNDAEWKAFVKLYRESSDIKAEYSTCRPRGDS